MTRWVLVTRHASELVELGQWLAPNGIEVVPYPVLREVSFEDVPGWTRLSELVDRLAVVVFTSRRAPAPLLAGARAHGLAEALLRLDAAAVGESTAAQARHTGFTVSTVGLGGASDLAAVLTSRLAPGSLVLHACGRERRDELAAGLAAASVETVPLIVYAMEPAEPESLPPLPDQPPAAVVLTSPRAVRAYLSASGGRLLGARHLALGATTARAAERLGINAVTLDRPTPEAILEELCQTCS